MFSKKLSGAENRKRKAQQEKEKQKQAGSFLKFLAKEKKADETSSLSESHQVEAASESAVPMIISETATDQDVQSSSNDPQPMNSITSNTEETVLLFTDIAHWKLPLSDSIRLELALRGPDALRHIDGPFAEKKRIVKDGNEVKRCLNKSWFYTLLPSGEKILRSWLVYSPLKESLFCYCCCLFAPTDDHDGISSFVKNGFQNWWKLNPKVDDHQKSPEHKKNFDSWKKLTMSLNASNTIDKELQKQIEVEKQRWRDILTRILDALLFLAKQNLGIRAHREGGNFIELLKLISKYDPVMREHFVAIRDSNISYLSPEIQNEFISLLGSHVKKSILQDIRQAKYFSVILDTTPDISHTDQMSEIIRYVKIEKDEVEVIESFIDFLPVHGSKTAANLTNVILEKLKTDDLDFNDCRGQGYDNAATMAGEHSGVQKRLLSVNPKAVFVPCNNHSLNLAGVHSASATTSSVRFFATVEEVYRFFNSSTLRWDVLQKHISSSVHRPSDTRWSANQQSVNVLAINYEQILQALEDLTAYEYRHETRGCAENLQKSLRAFHFVGFLNLWQSVLSEINKTQQYLQTSGLTLSKCTTALKALLQFVVEKRESLIEEALEKTTSICERLEIQIERRVVRKKRMPGEQTTDEALNTVENLRREMFQVSYTRFIFINTYYFEILYKTINLFINLLTYKNVV